MCHVINSFLCVEILFTGRNKKSELRGKKIRIKIIKNGQFQYMVLPAIIIMRKIHRNYYNLPALKGK